MPSPFPGMDPYLEDPALWPDVHANLIVTFQELLNQTIRPKYVARVEARVYMVPEDDPEREFWKIPDVRIEAQRAPASNGAKRNGGGVAIAEPIIVHQNDPIREGRIEILEVAGKRIVTVVELLSPSNKIRGAAGRASFLEKRDEVMNSTANWVEIDLLREGTSHLAKTRGRHQYYVYSSPKVMRPRGKAWRMDLKEALKVVGIPLRAPDPDAPLDLQAALTLAYDRAAYDATTDYAKEPVPPLPADLAKWANKLLKQKKLR